MQFIAVGQERRPAKYLSDKRDDHLQARVRG